MRRKTKVESTRRGALREVANIFGSDFKQARSVLTVVRAVPTVLPQFDHATGVGGFPTERISVMHGPSNGGKTICAIALMHSFLSRGHYVLFVDAEWSTPQDWVEKIMGSGIDDPNFFVVKPSSFEQTRKMVSDFFRKLQKAKTDGTVSPETSGLLVVDSIRKLVSEKVLDKMLKDEGGLDGMGGRGAMQKAAMNAQWMDELVPLLGESGGAALLLARETEDPDADAWSRKYGNNYKVGGGRAIVYDASLVLRVERAGWVTRGEGSDKEVFGERHRITITKTKIAGKEDKRTVCYFHSSNGKLTPFGLDRARDLLELGKRFGIVHGEGVVAFGRQKWRGVHAAAAALSKDDATLSALESAVRAKFAAHAPIEHDADGVVSNP